MDVSYQVYGTVALFLGKEPLYPVNRRWNFPRTDLNSSEKEMNLLFFPGTEGSHYKDQSVNFVRRTGLC